VTPAHASSSITNKTPTDPVAARSHLHFPVPRLTDPGICPRRPEDAKSSHSSGISAGAFARIRRAHDTDPVAHEHVVTMNEQTILDTVQRWRRKKYSARPFALTILAIALMTLLAVAKDYRSHVGGAGSALVKRELMVQDEEVGTV
jgi:hypothetical protein